MPRRDPVPGETVGWIAFLVGVSNLMSMKIWSIVAGCLVAGSLIGCNGEQIKESKRDRDRAEIELGENAEPARSGYAGDRATKE